MKKLLIAMCLMLPAVSALAVQNFKIGGVAISPIVSVQEKYDTNIYLAPRVGRKASLINRTMGGLGFTKEGSRLSIKGAYTLEGLFYNRSHRNNDAVHHNANVNAEYKLAGERMLSFGDRYEATTDQATSQLTARAKRVLNAANFGFESPLKGKFGYGVNAQHTVNDYLSSNYKTLNRDEVIAGVDITYRLQPKTKLLLAYQFGSLKYKERILAGTGDAVFSNVDAGLTGDLAPKLTGKLTAGAQFRKYRHELANASNSGTTGGYGAQLNWKPAQKTEVILFGKRANVESVYGDSRFYIATLNDLSVSRELNKIKVTLGGSHESIRYPEEVAGYNAKRHDSNYSGRVVLDYNIQKWLKASISDTARSRLSNERTNNYYDNVVSVELKGKF